MASDRDLPRSACPVCHRKIVVRLDWRLRAHRSPGWGSGNCAGSWTIAERSPAALAVLEVVAAVLEEAACPS